MVDIDGQNLVNIANHPGTDQIPCWAPEDMEMISYTSSRDGNGEVYIMNSDGSDNHRVTFNSDQDVCAGWGEVEETPTVALSIAGVSIAEGNGGTREPCKTNPTSAVRAPKYFFAPGNRRWRRATAGEGSESRCSEDQVAIRVW